MNLLQIILAGVFSVSALFLTAGSSEASLSPEGGLPVVEKNATVQEIQDKLKTEPVVFQEADDPGIYEKPVTGYAYYSTDNAVISTELAYRYYFKGYNDGIIEGEIYKSECDTEESIGRLKQDIYDEVKNGAALSGFGDPFGFKAGDVYNGHFYIGDAFIPVNNATTVRTANAVFNNELLGRMTDYETVYILNNPANEKDLWMLVTHETYLKPTQTSNRNFKGVGVEFKLDLKGDHIVRGYGPTLQANKTISYSGGFNLAGGSGGSDNARTNFGFSYTTLVESPKVYDASQVPDGVDIRFEYVDPGSWYGDYCEYNSGTTVQCSLAVLKARKTDTFVHYTSEIKSRFQKYENWPFPWVDEYYSIFNYDTYRISDLVNLIDQANA